MSKDSRAGFGLPLRQGHRHHQYVVMGGTVRRVLGKNTQRNNSSSCKLHLKHYCNNLHLNLPPAVLLRTMVKTVMG